MNETPVNYVLQSQPGGWRIAGTRVSLDSVIRAYWEGRSAEAIVDEFPSLSLEQVHGALAFYLHHREEVDRYLIAQDRQWELLRQQSESAHGPLLQRIRAGRQATSRAEENS